MKSNEFDQLNKMRQKLITAREQLRVSEEKHGELQEKYDALLRESSYSSNLDNLAAGIAHEIRNPLTTVRGFIQLIKPYLLEVNKEEYANIAIGEIDRVNAILFQFLNELKPQKSEAKEISVNKLIHNIQLLYEGEANLHNIAVQSVLAPEDPIIYANELQLKQVLVNMMKNALEAISSSGRSQGNIYLRTELHGNKVVISIKDNGCGMKEDLVDAVFSPFYSTKTTGTGLGLSISKKIIQEHGGSIHITSSVGEGTTLQIELPSSNEHILHA